MYDWKLSRGDRGSPLCLAHNVVSLFKPRTPGQIVLVDSGHSFHVHIRPGRGIDQNDMAKVCFQVKETLLTAIKQVFDILHLDGISASPAFFCPCERDSHSHFASPDLFNSKWHLYCSITEECVGQATDHHLLWLDTPSADTEIPSLPKLYRLEIPLKVGAKYFQFGVLLLNDEDGTLVEALEDECNRKRERIVRKILVEGARGRGMALSWKTLSDTLRECSLSSLADDIDSIYT